MQDLHKEAKAGAFERKGDAVRRRNELLQTTAAPTEPAATAEPDAASEHRADPIQAAYDRDLEDAQIPDVW